MDDTALTLSCQRGFVYCDGSTRGMEITIISRREHRPANPSVAFPYDALL